MAVDVFGNALMDYHRGKMTHPLLLHTSYEETEEMPVEVFFRDPGEFTDLELIALALCDGNVLDVGAGAGSHALCLQTRDIEVCALEISEKACTVMQSRGIHHIIQTDFFEYKGKKFDTLLFLMNGIGIAGDLAGLKNLLMMCRNMLNEGGQLLFDSSDIDYLYADRTVAKPPGYYGEIMYQYEYKGLKGSPFKWLYIDQATLIQLGHDSGWVVQVLHEDDQDQYLVRMELRAT